LLLTEALAEFVQQTRLAHPRLGHDVDHANPATRLDEGALQNLLFALGADIGAEGVPGMGTGLEVKVLRGARW
jgi:hypothetical protein